TAGGDYAVSFGAYAGIAAADAVIASLKSAQLPAYREPTTSAGKPAWRVRIGPFATRAEAESARLRAAHVRDDVGAQVVVLDAAPATSAVVDTVATAPARPAAPTPRPMPTTAKGPAVVAAPATTKPDTRTTVAAPKPPAAAATGFAVQLAAFGNAAQATALRDRLRAAGFSAFTETVTTDKGALTRVRVGPVASRGDAEQLQAQVKAKLGLDGIVRPHP
ncbi:MAG TPA: SPOR domain-containing protein, partial [Xanthomonadaceae bacterium]|nr:SPOR domain-containing protein [Xanthomonadaceae bacterium]